MRWTCLFALVLAGCADVPREPFKESVSRVVQTHSLKETVDRLAQPLIDSGRNLGMVIAVSTPQGEGIYAYGSQDNDGRVPMTTDQVFGIGSVTKAFTALLAADLHEHHAIDVDGPVGSVLPKNYAVSSPDMKRITFAELSSHTSGLAHEGYTLAFLWGTVTYLLDGRSLYRYYDTPVLENYVHTHDFTMPEKKGYAYSNIGQCYLGWLLGLADHRGYGMALSERVLKPLGLAHTGVALAKTGGRNLTPGYAGDLPTFVPRHAPVEPWLFDDGIAGAGGLYSTAGDLLTFAKANLGLVKSPLSPAMALTRKPRAPAEGGQICMAWFIKTLPDTRQPYTYIAGIVGGHTSFVGFDERRKVAVVVLQNSINHDDMIGVTLLDRLVGAQILRSAASPNSSGVDGGARHDGGAPSS